MTSVICDLDGVVYTGDQPVPRSAEALRELRAAGVPTFFATNNSTRTPDDTADKIARLTGVDVDPAQVVTSAQAAASLVSGNPGPALVVGGNGIVAALSDVGIGITDDPLAASVVIVGMDQDLTYAKIARATAAIRNGARFVASNDDSTYPTPEGLLPGAGAVVAGIARASGVDPVVAGKPNAPIRTVLRERAGGDAWVIGDRVETDIEMANLEDGWRSVLVLTGITGPDESDGVADFVVADLFEAVEIVKEAAGTA